MRNSKLTVETMRPRLFAESRPRLMRPFVESRLRGHASGNEKVKFMTDLAYPVLATVEARPGEAKLRQVRWNNDDRTALVARDPDEIAHFYAAAKRWVEILRRPESEYWEQLKPGRPICESFVWGAQVFGSGNAHAIYISLRQLESPTRQVRIQR